MPSTLSKFYLLWCQLPILVLRLL